MSEPITQLDLLRQTFAVLGIAYEEKKERGPESWNKSSPKYNPDSSLLTALVVDEGNGYGGFKTLFYFDDMGKFVTHAVVE